MDCIFIAGLFYLIWIWIWIWIYGCLQPWATWATWANAAEPRSPIQMPCVCTIQPASCTEAIGAMRCNCRCAPILSPMVSVDPSFLSRQTGSFRLTRASWFASPCGSRRSPLLPIFAQLHVRRRFQATACEFRKVDTDNETGLQNQLLKASTRLRCTLTDSMRTQ